MFQKDKMKLNVIFALKFLFINCIFAQNFEDGENGNFFAKLSENSFLTFVNLYYSRHFRAQYCDKKTFFNQ